MMRTMTAVKQHLTAATFIVLGLMTYGCGDTATVNPVVELASLAVDPGTLQPAFSGGTTQYTVDLSNNITSVTITALPAVSGDTITINGQSTTNSVIPLGAAGTTTPVSIVVSETGTNSRTYTVLLVRAGLTGNNSLQGLAVSPGTLDSPFAANDLDYRVDVTNNVGSVTVTPTLSDPAATMTVNGQATTSGQARTVTLNPAGQPTNIPIVVTAQNGNPKTYFVTVSRGVSSNNNLQSLAVSPGALSSPFSANRTSYTVNVVSTVENVTVTPRLRDTTATMTVNGQATTSGQAQTIPLNPAGSNTFANIIVTAQNNTQKTYIVNIARAALGGNNNLSGLTVSPGSLNPVFSSGTQNYTVNVGSSVDGVTVTPSRQDPNATITINGTAATSGQGRSITLNGAGSNTTINIGVTAPNGSQKNYAVNVSRAALGGNNNLSGLTISPGTLAPTFSAGEENYTANVTSGVSSVTVTPTRQDPNATITVNGTPATSGQGRSVTLNGAGANTLITIVVTAPNGTQKPYTVNVERAALGGNNNLQNLTVSPGALSPTFNANRTNYTVDVGSGVTSVTVTPTRQDPNSTLTVNGQPATSGQASPITLNGAGSNTLINIMVTAPNGSQRTYTVTVDRAALGGNNDLQNLTVSPGNLSPAFRSNRTGYSVSVDGNVDSLTVTATPQDAGATLTINGQGISSGQPRAMPLGPPGSSTEIDVTVIAPNGNQKSYQIDANRAEPAAPPAAPASAPDLISADDSCLLKFGLPAETGTNDDCDPATISTSSRDDNSTKVTTPRFAIPQPGPGLTPNLYVDGNKVPSTFNPGNSTIQPTTPLSGNNDGIQHSITSTVINTATTLESPQSEALTVTISAGQSGV